MPSDKMKVFGYNVLVLGIILGEEYLKNKIETLPVSRFLREQIKQDLSFNGVQAEKEENFSEILSKHNQDLRTKTKDWL